MRVRLFAVLRERAGSDSIELELAEGATVADALGGALRACPPLAELLERLPVRMAVNRDYASPETPLSAPADELALIPPISGGADPHVRVTGRAALARGAVRGGRPPGRRRDRRLPGRHPRGEPARLRGLRRRWPRSGSRRSSTTASSAARAGGGGRRAPDRRRRARRGQRDRRRLRGAPRRSLRRRPRGDRPDQGRGPDLEARGRGGTGVSLGRGRAAVGRRGRRGEAAR